ncbi:MAG: ATP-dependent DNA helicase RecQ [Flavobacteriales bacterium]|nr:MAG: ATP-dependent DNA helicase RecQ [Flavobacteriales bacterium]
MSAVLPIRFRPHDVLQRHWGYAGFRPAQESIIRSVLSGNDTLALLPTGGGKSLCYQVPALAMGRLCLVVSPLIALMKDQVEGLRRRGVNARQISSGMRWAEIDNTLEAAANGKLDFLYVSPERLGTEVFKARLKRLPLGLIAVDEAHCISQWGYDFRPAYLQVAELREAVPGVPVIALTATATAEVARDIMDRLGIPPRNLIRGSFARPELVLWVSRGEDRMGRLLRILDHVEGSSIVYMRDRKGTVRIARFLQQQGHSAVAYHAGLPPRERDAIQQDWTAGAVRCVVATNAFGMGIDKADVRSVIHLEPPPDLESYYQEAGRGGRDGRTAYAFLLTGPGDEDRAWERLRGSYPTLPEVRRTYQAVADLHGIALGSGLGESYEIDLTALAARTKLRPAVVLNALKAIELSGLLALSDGAHSPSRVLMRAAPADVYRLRLQDVRLGPLVEALLRLHGGLFEEAAIIDEARIGRLTGMVPERVERGLEELERMGILSYRKRSDAPSATLLAPRLDADRLTLDPQALRLRQERAEQRLQAMLAYVRGSEGCRMVRLLTYFDEPSPQPCGRCDACVADTRRRGLRNDDRAAEPLAAYDRDVEAERYDEDERNGLRP